MLPSLATETYAEPTIGTVVTPIGTQKVEERQKIIDAQYKCFEKMYRDPSYNKTGKHSSIIYLFRAF